MSNVVVPLEADPHQAVQGLLPWYARGSLGAEESALVREHLQHCAGCRAELTGERSLQAALADCRDEEVADTEAALVRMRSKLKAEPKPRPAVRWMPWALGLQSVAIAALVLVASRPGVEAPAPYKGLSASPAAAPAEALVMFRPDASEPAIRRVLLRHQAVIVGGPTESGAYRLELGGGTSAMAALRAEPVVTLAESLQPPDRP